MHLGGGRVVVRDTDRTTDSIVLRALLNHVNQRFRFSYVLGQRPEAREVPFTDFDDEDEDENSMSQQDAELFSNEEHGAARSLGYG